MNYEAMKEELAQRLQKKRYEHSLGVADTAAMLAGRFGAADHAAGDGSFGKETAGYQGARLYQIFHP